ncbi:MAG: HTH domain-containing protein [Clostridiales bacterium]|nr:HTH domain-containing protein [Clostridiales bacterium]
MAKKNKRGKIRDRIDYSKLLSDINTKKIPIKKDVPKNIKNNSCDENRKDFFRMMSDEKNLYFYQRAENIIHEKHCELLKHIKLENLRPLTSYKKNKKQCPDCALRAYLRMGAEDYKKYKEYDKLFKRMRADMGLIRKIFVELKFKTRLCDTDTIRIQYGDENWKIKSLDSRTGRVSLSHNDYRLYYDGTRKKYGTYHIQNERCRRTTFQNAVNVITKYKSHRPLSAYTEREQQVIKILKNNPKETRINMAKNLGVSVSTISRTVQTLKNSKTIRRIGGKRYGYWNITM